MDQGYRIRLAENSKEVLKWAYRHKAIDLIILDPDLPDADELSLLEKLEDRIPSLPVIVHTFLADYANMPTVFNFAAFVEKSGNSIEYLKRVVFDILQGLDQAHTQIAKDRDIYPS
jgi:DNA-binding NtrC family response regulator